MRGGRAGAGPGWARLLPQERGFAPPAPSPEADPGLLAATLPPNDFVPQDRGLGFPAVAALDPELAPAAGVLRGLRLVSGAVAAFGAVFGAGFG